MATTITVGGGQGQSTLTLNGNTVVPDVSFSVTLSNPCLTATIDNIVFSPTSLSVTDGNTGTATFSIPQDTVDQANTVQDLCGTKTYEIKDSSNAVITSWASIALSTSNNRQYILTIDTAQYPSHIASDVSETLTITTKYASWGSNNGNSASTIAVTLVSVTCDCSGLQWSAPSISTSTVNIDASVTPMFSAPDPDTSATTSNYAYSVCYENSGTCATTGTYAASSDFTFNDGTGATTLPSWITFDSSTKVLTVAPTDVALAGKTYTIAATYTPTYGTASSFTIAEVTVNCVVTSFTRPANPTSGLT